MPPTQWVYLCRVKRDTPPTSVDHETGIATLQVYDREYAVRLQQVLSSLAERLSDGTYHFYVHSYPPQNQG